MKKILLFVVLAMLMCSTVFAASDIEPTLVIEKQTLWDRIVSFISPGKFSTSSGPGSFIERRAGELYDMKFVFSCDLDYTQQKFTVDYSDVDTGTTLLGKTSTYSSPLACKKGEWYWVTIQNFKVPTTFTSQDCGQLFNIMVKHEGYYAPVNLLDPSKQITPSWKIDYHAASTDVNGYERLATLKLVCDVNPCDGLTGKTSGSRYCDGQDVAQRVYTDFVRNGACYARQDIVQNCVTPASMCSKGQCISNTTPVCSDSSWSPSLSTVCSDKTVTQTSNCGTTREKTGTKACEVTPPADQTPITQPPVDNISTTDDFTGNIVNYWAAKDVLNGDETCTYQPFFKSSGINPTNFAAFNTKFECNKYYGHWFQIVADWFASLFVGA